MGYRFEIDLTPPKTMILAAAHAGAYRAVEPPNAALTPSQLRIATPRSPRSTASAARAGSLGG